MFPPDKPLEEIPVALYHWGGVIVNMSMALLTFVVLCGRRSFSSAGAIPGHDVFCRRVVGIAQWHPVQAGDYQ